MTTEKIAYLSSMIDSTDDEMRKSFEDFMVIGESKKKKDNRSNNGNVTPNKIVWSKIQESGINALLLHLIEDIRLRRR